MDGGGISIVAGGNGSGKSLLCAATRVAALPESSGALLESLKAAGLHEVALLGMHGLNQSEWTIDLGTGAIRLNSPSNGNSPIEIPFGILGGAGLRTPHFVVNGDWPLPCETEIEWAARMICRPLEIESAAWRFRQSALEQGLNGRPSRETLRLAVAALEEKMNTARASREEHERIETRATELNGQIADAELARQIAAVEENELVSKVELAERVVHLESWARELAESWNAAEGTRERFAALQERLEYLQPLTRNVPEHGAELAEEFLRLDAERAALSKKAEDQQGRIESLQRKNEDIAAQIAELSARDPGADASDRESELAQQIEQTEREYTELSRRRIDLLRHRDGLEQQRNERFRDLAGLSRSEWSELEKYLKSDTGATEGSEAEMARLRGELDDLNARLTRDFGGYDQFGTTARDKIDQLFNARDTASVREAELIQLRHRLSALNERPSGSALKGVLSVVGAAAAGIPVGMALGTDIGFFAAVIGGGLGFGIGKAVSPTHDKSQHDEMLRRLEALEPQQYEHVARLEALEKELGPLATFLTREGATEHLREYQKLVERKRSLDGSLSKAAAQAEQSKAPALLRRIERDEMQRSVEEFKSLEAQIADAQKNWSDFETAAGDPARLAGLQSALEQLRGELQSIQQNRVGEAERMRTHLAELTEESQRCEAELRHSEDVSHLHEQIAVLVNRMAEIDALAGRNFSSFGAEEVVAALNERAALQAELRDLKQRLSSDHSPQEFALRTRVIEDELRQLTERLQEIDPLFATLDSRTEGLDKYREQMQRLFQNATDNEQRTRELHAELADLNLDEHRERFAALQPEHELVAERDEAQARLDELERSIHAARSMSDALAAELEELREHARDRVLGTIQTTVFDAIGERFAGVEWSGAEWRVVLEDGQRRGLHTLSRGTAELVTLCINAGLLTASAEGELCPVMWDDVLAQLDDHHLDIARSIIEKLARSRQVILLTRDARMRAWGKPVEVLAGHYQLSALTS